jgi:hypothetical protein
MKIRQITFVVIALAVAAAAGAQSQPQIKNAQVETRAVSGGRDSLITIVAGMDWLRRADD